MNKKIVGVLTALLIVALAVPVFADSHMEEDYVEDKVEITGEVKSVFQVGSYGDNEDAAVTLLEDDDALDEDATDDPDLFPAEKAFYQEVDINVAGMVNDNITFDLAVDTLTKNFTAVEGPENDATPSTTLGDQGANSNLNVDTALLTVSDDVSTLKVGDLAGFQAGVHFIDDEDVEGMELTTAMNDAEVRAFVAGEDNDAGDDAANQNDYYGVTYKQNFTDAYLAGDVYTARENGKAVSAFGVEGEMKATDAMTVGGEVIVSDADKDTDLNATKDDYDGDGVDEALDGDTLMRVNADYAATDALTLNAKVEMVGEDFAPNHYHDLEETTDYDMFVLGGEMVVDENNTVNASYTMVTPGDKLSVVKGGDEDKSTIEVGMENITGDYTNNASIAFTTNDTYTDNSDVTVIKAGTEYAMDAATVSAEITNQSADNDNEFTYLVLGYDQQVAENVTWNTEAAYLDGTTAADVDGESTHLETALTVSF